jgi:hypothetical protein
MYIYLQQRRLGRSQSHYMALNPKKEYFSEFTRFVHHGLISVENI